MLILPGRFNRQPQGNVEIDRDNSITRNLVSAFVPSNRYPFIDIASKIVDSSTTRLFTRPSVLGTEAYRTGSINWNVSFATSSTWPVSRTTGYPAITIFTLFQQFDTTSTGNIWAGGQNGTVSSRFNKENTGAISFQATGNDATTIITTPSTLDINRPYAITGIAQTNYRELFVDGISVASSTSAATLFNSTFTRAGGAGPANIGIFCSFIWVRRLTENEIKSITNNPWQIFRPQRKLISLPPPAITLGPVGIINPTKKHSKQPQITSDINYSDPITQGLIGSWTMSSKGYLHDASINKRHSNIITSSAVTARPSVNGRELKFSGSQANEAVSWGDVDWAEGLSQLTIEIDAFLPGNPNYPSGAAYLLSKWGSTSAEQSFYLGTSSYGRIYFGFNINGTVYSYYSENWGFNWDTRVHLVLMWFGGAAMGSAYFIRNGRKHLPNFGVDRAWGGQPTVNGITSPIQASTSPLQLGRLVSGENFNGSIGMINIWNRALSDSEAHRRYYDRWGMFKTERKSIFLPPPTTTIPAAVPYLRTKENTTNLEFFPKVNTEDQISKSLTNILVYARLAPHVTTSIKFDNSQISHHGPGNPASNGALLKSIHPKYGVYNYVNSDPDVIQSISTFTTILTSDSVTLLHVFKIEATTNVIAAYGLLGINNTNRIAALWIDAQSTGTVSQIRIGTYFGNSSWVTIPTGQILCAVLTHNPAVGQKLYINGVLTIELNVTGNLYENVQHLRQDHGGVWGSNNSHQTNSYFSALWRRAVTYAEIQKLSENPLRLLKPKRQLRILTPERPYETPKAIFPVKKKYARSQPKGQTSVNWSNPITRGLVSAYVPNTTAFGIDSVTNNKYGSTGYIPIKAGPLGLEASTEVSGNYHLIFSNATRSPYPGTTAVNRTISVFTLYRQFDTSSYGMIWGGGNSGVSATRFYKNADGTVGWTTQGISTSTINSPTALDINKYYALAGISEFDYREMFIDGISVASASDPVASTATNLIWTGTQYFTSNVDRRRMGIALGCVWNRRLTVAEIKSLTDNPWQLFNADRPFIGTEPPISVPSIITPKNRFFYFFN